MGFDWRAQADDAAALCRLLEGLPLGLELAAAWVHVFSLAEIAAAIRRSQAELAVSWQNTPERHHSLAAALAYSWQMLTPPEQAALARLAVFRQGFTAAAAQMVGRADARLLAGLVEKSLVRRGEHGRYDLHEQVRQFAWEKLAGQQAQVLADHMAYFAAYLGERETAVTGPEQAQFLRAIHWEGGNVRLAWETAVQQHDVNALSQMAGTLFHFYSKHGRQREGFALFGEAVALLEVMGTPTPEAERLLAACLIWQGRCGELIHQGFTEPERLLRRGLALARRHELTVEMAQGLMGLGLLALIQNRPAESDACFQESLAICQQADIPWTTANVLQLTAWLRASQGEAAQAQAMAQQAIALQQATGDLNGEAAALNTMGKVESDLGDHAAAEAAYARAWALCRQTGHRVGQAQALTGLFGACMRQGKVTTAVAHAQGSLQLNQEAGNRLGEAIACHNLGYAWAARQDHRQAVSFYRRALAIYEALGGNKERMDNTQRYLEESLQAMARAS
jgi:tetratricopeptide (TPR) repeat protein